APLFSAAVERGEIEDREESEWMLLGRLRAAAAGLAFLPTRAALGSELLSGTGLLTVLDPYTGNELLALPPLHPDVCLLHAWRADPQGNVQLPRAREHLWDVDLLLARAARSVIVTVEELVGAEQLSLAPELTVLHAFEVDLVVEAPGGAAPTACEPAYGVDVEAIARAARGSVG
ncbi:MAG: CoA-transferase, partial [Solirubrobacteraceae bacterium]